MSKPADAVNGDMSQTPDAASAAAATGEDSPEALQTNGSQSTTSLQESGDPPVQSEARAELEDYRPQSDQQQPAAVTAARRRHFNRIITNCVLQLLMIETVHELFSNENVYAQIPSGELLRLMGLLKKSYQFAKKFNEDKDLRMQLWRQGFMKQPPNLLKQESGSASTYVHILFRMYHDEREERQSSRAETEAALIPYVNFFSYSLFIANPFLVSVRISFAASSVWKRTPNTATLSPGVLWWWMSSTDTPTSRNRTLINTLGPSTRSELSC